MGVPAEFGPLRTTWVAEQRGHEGTGVGSMVVVFMPSVYHHAAHKATTHVRDLASGRNLGQFRPRLDGIRRVAFSPDGKRLALACGPRDRQTQEANAYILKMPETSGAAVSQLSK